MKIKQFTTRSLIFSVSRAYDDMWRKLSAKIHKHGCNLTESMILIAIYFEPDKRAKPSDLSEALGTSRGNVSHHLNKLQSRGWITRSLFNHDLRHIEVSLTTTGTSKALTLIDLINRAESDWESYLGKDVSDVFVRAFNMDSKEELNSLRE